MIRTWSPPGAATPLTSSRRGREPRAATSPARADPRGAGRPARGKVPDKPVWHCVVRAAPGDPDLGGGAWQVIIAEMMHRTGLSEHGRRTRASAGSRCTTATTTSTSSRHWPGWTAARSALHGDWYRIGEAMAWAEKQYGLTPVARAGPRGTAGRGPPGPSTRRRPASTPGPAGPAGPCRPGTSCAATSRRPPRPPAPRPSSSPGWRPAASRSGSGTAPPGPVRSPGTPSACGPTPPGPGAGRSGSAAGKLAPDLTLPRLRARWAGGPAGPDRCTRTGPPGTGPAAPGPPDRPGHERPGRPGRAGPRSAPGRPGRPDRGGVLRPALGRAGLLVRLRPDPDRPGRSQGTQ